MNLGPTSTPKASSCGKDCPKLYKENNYPSTTNI